jgi:hypothetical protein
MVDHVRELYAYRELLRCVRCVQDGLNPKESSMSTRISVMTIVKWRGRGSSMRPDTPFDHGV